MSGARILKLGCIGLVLSVTPAQADRALRLSTKHLVAESPAVVVTHDHDVKHIKTPESLERDEFVLQLNSTLRIVRKSDQEQIFNQPVMPLTALVSVDDGRFFAGLSNLKTLSFAYNFILVSANGQIVTTALITPTSGHCKTLSSSVTNSIRWFDESAPKVQLSFVNDRVDEITVANPYDIVADGTVGKCLIRVEPPDAASAEDGGRN